MNLRALLLIFLWGSCLLSYAQERDTTYIQPYSQEIWLRAYTPTKMLLHKEKRLIRLTTHLV